jgi:acetyltransferase-like isoleucine patch superfamily enzyme
MLKKLIRKVCYKLYTIGYFEYHRLQNVQRMKRISEISKIHPSVWLSESAEIYNNSRPAEKLVIGARSRIMGQLFLFDADGEIIIGEDCFVGPQTRIWSAKKIKVGNRVLIAHNVNVHDNISHPLDAQLRYQENKEFVATGKHKEVDIKADEIIIEDDVWIGFNVTVMKGIRIGRGAIIGANSIVTKDVPAWTVNVGNPLRCIRTLEEKEVSSI